MFASSSQYNKWMWFHVIFLFCFHHAQFPFAFALCVVSFTESVSQCIQEIGSVLSTSANKIQTTYIKNTQATKLLFLSGCALPINTMNSIMLWRVLSTKLSFLMNKSCFFFQCYWMNEARGTPKPPLSCRAARVST